MNARIGPVMSELSSHE